MSMLLMNAISLDASTTKNSTAMTLSLDTCVSFHVSWTRLTGTLAGTLYLQVSNDNSDWITTTEVFPANPNTASAPGSTAEVWSGFGYKYARIQYVPASGTGTMTIKAYSKRAA